MVQRGVELRHDISEPLEKRPGNIQVAINGTAGQGGEHLFKFSHILRHTAKSVASLEFALQQCVRDTALLQG